MNEPKWSQCVLQHFDIAAPTREWIESVDHRGHRSPHDAGGEDTVGGAADSHGSGHELGEVEPAVLVDEDAELNGPVQNAGITKI